MLSRKHTTKEIRIKEKKSENRQIELARTPGTRNKGDHVSEFFFSIADATVQAGQRLRYQPS
jgi:hypothetical protein